MESITVPLHHIVNTLNFPADAFPRKEIDEVAHSLFGHFPVTIMSCVSFIFVHVMKYFLEQEFSLFYHHCFGSFTFGDVVTEHTVVIVGGSLMLGGHGGVGVKWPR